MNQCPFCKESIAEGARKCKTCGESFGFFSRLLSLTPLLSVLIAAASLSIAFIEIEGRKTAETERKSAEFHAELALKEKEDVSNMLQVKEEAANLALKQLSQQLSVQGRQQVSRELELKPHISLKQLEQEAIEKPKDLDLQRKMYLYRALKPR